MPIPNRELLSSDGERMFLPREKPDPWIKRICRKPYQFYHTYWKHFDWKEWAVRVTLGVIIVGILFLFKIFGVVDYDIDHVHDIVHEWTEPINRELNRNL